MCGAGSAGNNDQRFRTPSPAGVLRPGPAWWSAAWAGPFPNTTAAARKAAQQYFAAPSGDCVTTPWSVAAMYSPRLLAVLQPAAYADFKARWNVSVGGPAGAPASAAA